MVNKTTTAFIIIFLALITLNIIFEPSLGNIFTGMLTLSLVYYLFDKSRRYELEKKQERTKSLVLAAGGFLALTIASSIVFPILQKTSGLFNFASTLQVLTSVRQSILFSSVNPALANNLVASLIVFSLLVTFIETMTLGILFEIFHDITNKTPSLKSANTWMIIGALSSLFTVWHFTALGVRDNLALASVLLFAIITFVIIIIEGQFLAAVLFHVIANTSTLLLSGQFAGLLENTFLVTTAITLASLYIFTRQPIRRVFSSLT